nr:unnamed protein product [Digitaria exilis]CAB3490059.1 unnamed protein product [Digitaria exilis]
MAWLARSIANSLLSPEEEEPSSSGPVPSASPGSSSPPRGVREDLSELTGALANRFQDFDLTDAQQDHALAVESVAPELADLRIELCPSHMSESCFWKIYFVLLHPKLGKEDAEILSTPQILEARGKLSHDLQYQTKLQSSNEDTIPVPLSNVDDALASPVEVLGEVKSQDGSVMATSFSNIDYGILQPNSQEFLSADAVSDAEAVSSDKISSSVPVQLVPVLKDTTVVSPATVEEITRDLATKDAAAEQSMQMSEIALVDNSPPKDDQQKQPPLAHVSKQSRVDSKKTYHDEDEDDGDEWLEEETGGPENTTIPIVDDEDVSFSDLEDDEGMS